MTVILVLGFTGFRKFVESLSVALGWREQLPRAATANHDLDSTAMLHILRLPLFFGICLLAVATAHGVERAAFLHAVNSITGPELRAHVDVLSDDSFEGREAGQRGGRAAAGYLRDRLQASGLRGLGDEGSFYQVFGNGYRNVLGLLEGSDPRLKHEVVLLGAHYDHVGYGSRSNSLGPWGYVHNGADDNASGTAGLLETMDAILRLPQRPKRSILIAFWDGEEKGLLGSKNWAATPTIPLTKVVFAINVDMIGRLREERLQIYGARSGWGLRRLLASQNNDDALRLDFDWEMKSNSDHHSFFSRKIPVLMFHTGLHDDYHRPSDDAHLVNVEGLERITRLMFAFVHELAEVDHVTQFRAAASRETKQQRRVLEKGIEPLPPRLGLSWKSDTSDGIRVQNVVPDSAAGRAGVELGDHVLAFDGQPVPDSKSFRLLVLYARSTTTIQVQREGESEPITLDIKLPGQPTRIGVSWRMDEAEPGTAIVTRVVGGSAAEIAGIRNGDRIYSVAGSDFSESPALLEELRKRPSPIEMTIEREGRLLQMAIDAPAPLQ